MMGGGGDSWSYKMCNLHHQETNTQFYTGWMSFLSPNQQCQSTEANSTEGNGSVL